MRARSVLAMVIAAHAIPAEARYRVTVPVHAAKPPHDFWLSAIEPHADEIRILLAKADAAFNQVDSSRGSDLDATAIANRARLFRELTDLLVYARSLAPADLDVLERLGRAADEAGQTPLAIDAFTTAYKLKPTAQDAARLAAIELRAGDVTAATLWARTAVAGGFTFDRDGAPAALYLSTALALGGDMASAIDTLQTTGPFDRQPEISMLALAVQLDRDEQRGAAADAIERMKTAVGEGWAEALEDRLAHFRFSPAEDAHYFRALFDEAIGADPEARTEWLIYAASEGAFAARARAHVVELDTRRRAPRPASEAVMSLPQTLRIQHKITP